MGTWSITPNTLASIDNNGRATFQEHTSQVVYTIKYTSDTCGTVTKQFTVYPCSPVSCDCSTFSSSTSGNRVPSSTGSTEYVVGYYTGATNCSDPITLSHRSGVDFLGNLRASNGTIYATVKAANSGNERSSTYYVRQSNCEDYFTAYQSAGSPTPVCSSSTHKLGSCVTSDGGSNILIGTYDSMEACSGSWTTRGTLPSWISNVSFSNGNIYATLSQNTSASERTGTVLTYLSDIGDDYFDVAQCGTGVCDCNAANLSITGVTDIPASGGTHVKIADFKSECYPTFSYSRKEGDNFLSSFGTHYNLVNKSGYTYADVSENTGNENRSETVNISIGTDVCKTFTVTQKQYESTTFKIKFSIENNFWGASNFTSAGLLLNGVSSIIFLDEVSGYVGSATTRTWECEIPNEYSGKTITAYTIERSHLGVDVIGTGATVLTENAEVGVFYGIYDFEIEEEVTKGELLNYKYKITDKTYYDRIYFDFIDSEGNTITSSTKQDMDGPIGKGSGSGKFQTSDMTTGRGYVKPYADRYKVYSNIAAAKYEIKLEIPSEYFDKGNTYIILGDNPLTPAQIAKQYTGNAIIVGSGGIATIGFKYVNASCDYDSYTFSASYNIPNDTSWTVGSLAVTDKYNVVNIDGNTVTTIGSFTMRDTDFNTCSDTIYDLS